MSEEHEKEHEEMEMKENDMGKATEYENLEQALDDWSAFANDSVRRKEVTAIIGRLSKTLGDAVRWHKPASESYIAVTFLGEPKKIGAYIHTGFIDHIIELPGSFVPDASPNYWRTDLSPA